MHAVCAIVSSSVCIVYNIVLLQNDPDGDWIKNEHSQFVIRPPETRNVTQSTIVPAVLENEPIKYVQYNPQNMLPTLPIVTFDSGFVLFDIPRFRETDFIANVSVITQARL